MIVKCGNCQTRFKIPDDKVTDKGVKVRCTKCQNTFRVTKADAQPAVAPPASAGAAEADPFAKFGGPADGPPAPEVTRPFQLPPDLAGMQPKVSGAAPTFEAQSDLPRELFESATRIGPPPTAPPPSSRRAMPGAAPPPKPAAVTSLPPSAFNPHTETTRAGPPPFDPFDFGAPATGSSPALSMDSPTLNASAPQAADPFDFSNPAPTNPAQRAATQPNNPRFDFGSLQGETTRPGRAVQEPATTPTAPAMPDPFAFGDEQTATKSGVAPSPNGAGMLGDAASHTDPFASPPSGQQADPFGLPPSDPFAAGASAPQADPFANAQSSGEATMPTGDAREMFDMPEKKPAPPPPEEPASVPLAAIKLQKIPASEISNPSAPTVPAVDPDEPKKPGAARRMTGVVMNLAIAAVIFVALAATALVYMNEGKVELSSFQPARLTAMLTSNASYTAGDLSNGLYDTKGGRPVFFVRGEVRNKGKQPGRVKVRAEILDGNTVIQSAEVMAGAAPTPEDLFKVSSSADLTALNARLQKESAEVQPGKTAPFLVTFYEFPPDLSPYRLKVTVLESGTAEQAAR